MIQSLQVFRDLAAFAVVAHHGIISTNAFVGLVPAQIESVMEVDIFNRQSLCAALSVL